MTQIYYPAQKKYLESFKKDENKLRKEMEEFAEENHVPILNWHAAEFIEKLIKIHQPEKVLEIGTAIAYTTIRIAEVLKRGASIHTIEKSKDNIRIAEKYIERSGCAKKIKLIEGDALNIMPQLDKKYDFIFLDADKEDYKRLFDYSMLLLKKGGVIVIDNLLWHGYVASSSVPAKFSRSTKNLRVFNNLFILQKNLDSMIIPIGDGLGLGVKR